MRNLKRVLVASACVLSMLSCKKNAAKHVQGDYEGTLIIAGDTTLNHIVKVLSIKGKKI